MDILSALNTLKSATAENLQHYHEEVLSTLATVETLLGIQPFKGDRNEDVSIGAGYPDTSSEVSDLSEYGDEGPHHSESGEIAEGESSVQNDCPATIDSVPDTSSHRPSQPLDWPTKMLETYTDDVRWLFAHVGNETSFQKRGQKDKRMEDIRRIEGDDSAKEEERILRALAQRSLGNLYTRLQRQKGLKQTRVDELFERICSSDPAKRQHLQSKSRFISRHIGRFSRDPDDIRDKKSVAKIRRSINFGVKQLVVEKLFSKRLSQSGQTVEFPGISAFTALQVKAFNKLCFQDIPRFLDYVFQRKVDLPINRAGGGSITISVRLADVFVCLSPWFLEIQNEYDKDYYPLDEWKSVGIADKPAQQYSLPLCSPFMEPNGTTLWWLMCKMRLIKDEDLTEGQTEHEGPLFDRADPLQPPIQPTTSHMVESMTLGHIAGRSTPTLQRLRDDAFTGSATSAEEKAPRLAQKQLPDQNTMDTELSRKRSAVVPASSGKTESTRALRSQVQAIDIRGYLGISRLINEPESATENPGDERTGQDLRPIQDKFNQQPQNVETRKRRSAQPLESAKPFKARRLIIQRDDSLAISNAATQDNHRQEATRPMESTIPEICPSSSQLPPFDPSESMGTMMLQVNSFHPTHHSAHNTMTDSRLHHSSNGLLPLEHQQSRGSCYEYGSNTVLASNQPQAGHIFSSRHAAAVDDSLVVSVQGRSTMRAVVQKDQGGNDMDGQDTGAAAPSRRQEHEPGFTIRRGHHTEFSGSQGASELLNLQNCSQVFDHPPQPAGGNSTSESAFREPGLVPLRNCFTSHGLNDFNYARAFEYPFQLASEISSTDNGRPDLYCPQLDDQNYARAFDYSFQPASEISISDIGQPGIQGRSASYQLDGQNYARAFDYPFQPASEILNSDSTFREADAHPDFTNGQYADDREDARNNARAFDHPTRFTAANPTPENSGCETGDLDYSTDSLDRRRPSNNYPSWIKAGGIHPPAEPAVYQNHARAFNEHCQRTMDELWSYEDITESFDTGTIQLVGEPHTAPLVA